MKGESEGDGSRTRDVDRSGADNLGMCRTVAEPVMVFDDPDGRILGMDDELDMVLACLAPDGGRCDTGVFMMFLSSSNSRGVRSCRPVEARHLSLRARGDIGLGGDVPVITDIRVPRPEVRGVVPSEAERKASPAAFASSVPMVIRLDRGLSWVPPESDDTRTPLASARPVFPTRTSTLAIAHSSRNSASSWS
jgi:hypothetical protein